MRWRANPLTSWGASYVRRFEECWHDWMQNQVQTQLFILLLVILLPLRHYCPLVFQPAAEMAQLLTDTTRGLLSAPGRIKCRHRSATSSSPSCHTSSSVTLLTFVFQPAAEMAQLLTDTMRGLLSAPGRIKRRHQSATSFRPSADSTKRLHSSHRASYQPAVHVENMFHSTMVKYSVVEVTPFKKR